MTLPFHPLSEIFPPLLDGELADLAEDIRVNGVREPITVLDGAILDGRNRYRALLLIRDSGIARGAGWGGCEGYAIIDEDLEPGTGISWFERYSPMLSGDPLAFVISKNLKRRHLDDEQRRMVAARIANMVPGRPEQTPQNAGIKIKECPTKDMA
jgi:hypothetical protein